MRIRVELKKNWIIDPYTMKYLQQGNVCYAHGMRRCAFACLSSLSVKIPSANSARMEVMFNDKFKFIIPAASIVGGHVLHDTDDTNSRVIRNKMPRCIPIISASRRCRRRPRDRRITGNRAILLRSFITALLAVCIILHRANR